MTQFDPSQFSSLADQCANKFPDLKHFFTYMKETVEENEDYTKQVTDPHLIETANSMQELLDLNR